MRWSVRREQLHLERSSPERDVSRPGLVWLKAFLRMVIVEKTRMTDDATRDEGGFILAKMDEFVVA